MKLKAENKFTLGKREKLIINEILDDGEKKDFWYGNKRLLKHNNKKYWVCMIDMSRYGLGRWIGENIAYGTKGTDWEEEEVGFASIEPEFEVFDYDNFNENFIDGKNSGQFSVEGDNRKDLEKDLFMIEYYIKMKNERPDLYPKERYPELYEKGGEIERYRFKKGDIFTNPNAIRQSIIDTSNDFRISKIENQGEYADEKGGYWIGNRYNKRSSKFDVYIEVDRFHKNIDEGTYKQIKEKGGEIETDITYDTSKKDKINFFINGNEIGFVDYYYNADIISDSLIDKIENGKEFYIMYLEVYPKYRGKRYTDKILSITENYAKEKGATIITLRPDYGGADKPENPYLDNLYLKNDFNYIFPNDVDEWGMYKNVYKEGGLIGDVCTYDFEGYELDAINCKNSGVDYLLQGEYEFVAKRLYDSDNSLWLYYNYINRINISWKDCLRFKEQALKIFPNLPYNIDLKKALKKSKRSYASYRYSDKILQTSITMLCCDKGWGKRFLDKNTNLPLPSLNRNDYYSLTTLIHELAHCFDYFSQYVSSMKYGTPKIVAGHKVDFVKALIKILDSCRNGRIPIANELDQRAYALQSIYSNPQFAEKKKVDKEGKSEANVWSMQMNSVISNEIKGEIDLELKKGVSVSIDQLNDLEIVLRGLDDKNDTNSFVEKLVRQGKTKEALKYHKLITKYLGEMQRLMWQRKLNMSNENTIG